MATPPLPVNPPAPSPFTDRFGQLTIPARSFLMFLRTRAETNASGTVTSVGLTMPTEFSVLGSPVTSSGTLAVTKASQAANTIWAAPSGAAGAPAFRTLVQSDMPSGIAPLPPATTTTLGGVKVGSNVSVAGDGTISVAAPYVLPVATTSILGGVKQGSGITIAGDGTLSVSTTTGPAVVRETPAGTMNGTNTAFTLSFTPNPAASLMLYLNGVEQLPTTDYTISGATITYTVAPKSTDLMIAQYTH